jgi:ABC-type Fe3+-hydroxamate transport system substrate-binding protein
MTLFFATKMRPAFPVMAATLIILVLALPVPWATAQKTAKPPRIVSLSPAITESLYLLGLGDNIIGVTTYCNRPGQARVKEKVGTVMQPNLEKILKLKPDLVLAMTLTDPKSIHKLKELGINVVTFPIADTFSDLCDVFLQIGRATGCSGEAARLVRTARARVDAVRRRTARLPKPGVLVQIGSKPFFVATKDVFMNDFIEFAGAANVFRDVSSGSVGREEAVLRDPDVILIVTMGLSGESERQAWKKFPTVKAVKNGQIYLIDSDEVCSPTPVSFAKSLGDIAALLHPGEAKDIR